MESKKLTLKQQKFVENYAQSGNGAESARLAGYSATVAKVQAHENLTKPNVKSALAEKRAEISAENADKREFFISHLETLAKTAQKEADQLRAVEMLMKAQGWNAPDKQEISQYASTFLADLDMSQEDPAANLENTLKNNDLH